MPIEIRELVIRAIVDPGVDPGAASGRDGCGGTAKSGGSEEAALVQACVAEVMRQLRLAGEP